MTLNRYLTFIVDWSYSTKLYYIFSKITINEERKFDYIDHCNIIYTGYCYSSIAITRNSSVANNQKRST